MGSPRVVVGAAILDGHSLLAAQRREPPELAGGWELPGGKVDPGESDEAALVRECREELGVDIALQERVGGDWALQPGYVLRVWTARIVAGTAEPIDDHSALRWLPAGHWYEVAWLSGDLPVVDALSDLLERAN